MRRVFFLIFALGILIPLAIAGEQGRGNSAGKGNRPNVAEPGNNSARAAAQGGFTREHERIIREWFSNSSNLAGLPPGLAKREQLPPGLQRQLLKNGKLPPGLQKRIQPLPSQLEARLPRLPSGQRRIVIAGNVILLEERTAAILDMITGIF